MRGMIRFFLTNRTAVLLFMFILGLMGAQSFFSLPREANPDLKIPVVLATVPYPGVSPADMESLVTRKLETEYKNLKDVKVMRSTSGEGISVVTIEFDPGVDIDEAVRKVREKTDATKPDLPKDAMDPVVQEISFEDMPIILVNISGDYSLVRLKQVAERLQDKLEEIPGVLEVDLNGGVEREFQVLVDPARLAFHNVSLGQINQALQSENINMPGGSVNAGTSSYLVRIPGEFRTAREIAAIPVKKNAGAFGAQSVTISDVARVIETYKERATISREKQRETVSLAVSKRAGENLIRITDDVKAAVEQAQLTMPPGTTVTTLQDQSKFVREIVNDLTNNIITGLLLILLVLPFFLTIRTSLIVATAIPLSLLISFFVIDATGMTLNMIVLFALVLALGMLVDNSIVIVENTYRLMSEGKGRLQAAFEGTASVAWPVVASTATTVAAFLPLLFWPGIMGKFMGFLPKTLIITLLASLFVALFINPVMCALVLKTDPKHVVDEEVEPEGGIYKLYRATLVWALDHKWLTNAGVAALFVGTMVAFGAFNVGVEFFPEGTPDNATIELKAASGTRTEAMDTVVRQVEDILAGEKHVKNYVATVGAGGGSGFTGGQASPNRAQITLEFFTGDAQKENPFVTIERLRGQLYSVAGVEFEIKKQEQGPPSGPPIGVEIIGDDWTVLGKLTADITASIKDIDGLVDLKDDMGSGRPELQVRVDRDRAKLVGTNTMMVASAVRTAINGTEATKVRDGDDEIDVVVRYDVAHRDSLDALNQITISGENGVRVPLREVATLVTGRGAASIRHKDSTRVITLSANAEGRLADDVRKDVVAKIETMEFPEGYSWRLAGQNEEQEKAQAFLGKAFMLAFLLIFLIMVLQFNSLVTPFIIMASVILSVVGVLWGLLVFQRPFGVIMTGLGVISLAGIAVNNAIVLIDFIIAERAKGRDRRIAVIRGGVIRLRPVLLTAITTVLGLLPTTFGVSLNFVDLSITVGGRSAEMWSGMAIAVVFGLTFTTFLTLVMVPMLYEMLDAFFEGLKARFNMTDSTEDDLVTTSAAPASRETDLG